jgi:hypothetical protein
VPIEITQKMASTAPRAAMVLGQDLPFWYPLNVVLTGNQQGVKATVTIDNDGDFQWRSLVATSTGLFSVVLTDAMIKRPMMPTPINGENLAGTSQQPALLPVPRRLKRTTIIEGIFNDRSGAGNTIQLALWGYKKYSDAPDANFIPSVLPYRKAISHVYLPNIDQLSALRGKIPYWWPLFDAAVGSQQAGRNKFTVPSGSYMTHIVGSSSQAAGFVLQMFDTERGQMFEDQPTVVSPNHVGSAQRPFWLKKVYRLPSDGQLQSRVINLAAAPNTIQVVMCGVRD